MCTTTPVCAGTTQSSANTSRAYGSLLGSGGGGSVGHDAAALAAYETFKALPPSEHPYTDYDFAIVAEILRLAELTAAQAAKRGQGEAPCGGGGEAPGGRCTRTTQQDRIWHSGGLHGRFRSQPGVPLAICVNGPRCSSPAVFCCALTPPTHPPTASSTLRTLSVGSGEVTLQRVLRAYEAVLPRHGVRPEEDIYYYRLLLKLSLDGGGDWWARLDREAAANRR